jgi:pyruvate-ferredoxin/flavodoxin oxidoreductase
VLLGQWRTRAATTDVNMRGPLALWAGTICPCPVKFAPSTFQSKGIGSMPEVIMVAVCIDGNEAAAHVAYRLSEAVGLYPITPASPMGELADTWAAARKPNLWGDVPRIIEMQSEGGAAGTLHGLVQGGVLGTTFTASQGLLLMLPNMYKIAGELTPAVIHVAARSIATHALSIFGDHSDVMAARATGWAMLASASPQEAHDLAAIAHSATLRSRVPFLHFFDGFRTSHEIARVHLLEDDQLASLVNVGLIDDHRRRAMSPDRPFVRGTAQNPDVFFQSREASNSFHDAAPQMVQEAMDALAVATGRQYGLVDYTGAPDAERVVVLMGSGGLAAKEVVESMVQSGEGVGVLQVRLFRPWPIQAVLDAIPSTVRRIAVLDRTKEPGSVGEPLHQDIVSTYAQALASGEYSGPMPTIIGGRYGLSSKEFTPQMIKGVFDELDVERPRPRITVGIRDDVTHLSVDPDPSAWSRPSSSASEVTEPSARTGTPCASSVRRPTCTRRATSCTTRRSRGRSRCRTCASRLNRSVRPT